MSQANVDTLREMFAIFNEQGIRAASDAFRELLAPDFRLEEAAELPDPERFSGGDAFIENLAKLETSFVELRMEPLDVVDLGDKVVAEVSLTGLGRGSSVPVEATFAQLWVLRDGKAVSLRDYPTKAEALEAAAASEG
jgi:ketosteroid isomerase-like protein